MTFFTFYNCD